MLNREEASWTSCSAVTPSLQYTTTIAAAAAAATAAGLSHCWMHFVLPGQTVSCVMEHSARMEVEQLAVCAVGGPH